MRLDKNKINYVMWSARIAAAVIIVLGLPFYFGYGNLLPFANPENTLFDNVWLVTFPLLFIGLGLAWKWEKLGGYIVVIPIILATIIGSVFSEEIGLPGPMLIPLITGLLFLIVGYKKN